MGRKKKLEINIDSASMLMQEIYNDISQDRHTASIIMKKMLNFMKDSDDMTLIGPIIKEQQKILNNCTDKKIALVKLQSILLKQTDGSGKVSNNSKLQLTPEDRKFLEEFMKVDNKKEKNEEKEDEGYFKK